MSIVQTFIKLRIKKEKNVKYKETYTSVHYSPRSYSQLLAYNLKHRNKLVG